MTETKDHSDIKTMSFEQALKELETIVDRLEKGDVELEASILIYERGEALKTHCDALLRKAEARVEKISLNQNGQPTGTEPLDVSMKRNEEGEMVFKDERIALAGATQVVDGKLQPTAA